jgi:hypothetical protein
MTKAPQDLIFYGTVEPTSTHAVTLPARARRELGLGPGPLFVFGSRGRKQLILTQGPESAPDLLKLLSEARDP